MSANLKRRCGILLGAAFIILSILALLPEADVDHDAGYISSELNIQETVDGSVTGTSYVNSDGVITEAIDMGYATVCRMWDENGRIIEERYLDANGDPVAKYGDYYGLSYGYDETSTVPMQDILSSNVPTIEMAQQIQICILMRRAIKRHCRKGSMASNAVAR